MKSGLGVRPELFAAIEQSKPDFGFLEAHSENYFGESISRTKLLNLREHYPISLHGVGLSLGRADDLDQSHLLQLKALADEVDPLFISEHLAWSAYSHRHLPDLLPLPLTDVALNVMCEHVDRMQTALGRSVLVENPSNYLVFDQLQIPEPEFLNELAQRTGCGLLVDVNNVHVSARNVGRDARDYVRALDNRFISQYHLAGYTEVNRTIGERTETLLIDTHNAPVYPPVWELFEFTLAEHGARPTLFEWDSDFPELSVLKAECDKADQHLSRHQCVVEHGQPKSLSLSALPEPLKVEQELFLDSILELAPEVKSVNTSYKHRIWVYQNNVFAALQDFLAEVFAGTRGVVGADFFKQMAQRYVQLTPPKQGNIHLYGHTFCDTVAEFEGLKDLPYLKDVINFEWALHSAYYSRVSNALDPSSIAQDELLQMPIDVNDSVSLIRSDYPILEIQRQSMPDYAGEILIDLSKSQDKLLIYKLDNQVNSLLLDDEQADFIEQLQKSENLLQAIEVLQGSISATSLSSALALVFNCRLLTLATEDQGVSH